MKSKAAVFLVLASLSATVSAGPFTDEMSKCLVKSTSEADKSLLIKWVFAAMASHPDVKSLSNVSTEKGDELNKNVSGLLISLLTEKCKPETQQAIQYEGPKALEVSFEVLGQVAMQGIISNPDVVGYMSGLGKHMDLTKLKNAFDTKPQLTKIAP